jgi:hypothetical protein
LSDAELLRYLQNKNGKCCGKLRASQLKEYFPQSQPSETRRLTLLKAGVISAFMLLLGRETLAQEPRERPAQDAIQNSNYSDHTDRQDQIRVSGLVRDELNQPMPGLNIILKVKTDGTTADSDGKFTFPVELKAGDVLVFSFIGYETKEFVVRKSNEANLQITMDMDDLQMLGEISVAGQVYAEEKSPLKKLWCKVKGIF